MINVLDDLIFSLKNDQRDIDYSLIENSFLNALDENVNEIKLASLLTTIASIDLTPQLLNACVNAVMQKRRSIEVAADLDVLDNCGTGGDRKSTLNISTMAAVVTASLIAEEKILENTIVIKFGNKAATSKSGSSTVLELMGLDILQDPDQMLSIAEKTKFGYCHAPVYHPSLRHVANVRKNLPFGTIFNIIGPLCHPIEKASRCIGVVENSNASTMASVLSNNKSVKRAWVYSTTSNTCDVIPGDVVDLFEVVNGRIENKSINTNEFCDQVRPDDIVAHNIDEAKEGFEQTLSGKYGKSHPIVSTVALNTAFAVCSANGSYILPEVYKMALNQLTSSKPIELIGKCIEDSRKNG